MVKVVIQAIDTYRHDYWKVPVSLLVNLNIVEEITEYSFLGSSNTPLNEKGFAYLEIDCDCGTFDKAMKFYNQEYSIDADTLQEELEETYDDPRDWMDEMDNYDTDILSEDYKWESTPSDLAAFLAADDEEEDEYDDEEDEE